VVDLDRIGEGPDAALFLEAARTLPPRSSELRADLVFPLLATFLLTGGRRAEVLGLELADVSFPRNTVTFRPNRFRRLKTATSARVVPLWPQLRDILTAYLSVRTAAMVLQDAPSTPCSSLRSAPAPVSLFTVAREMGHGGDSLVRRIYGHLGEVRHRAQSFEYRPEQHASVLGDRLALLYKGPQE
jgi:integrase